MLVLLYIFTAIVDPQISGYHQKMEQPGKNLDQDYYNSYLDGKKDPEAGRKGRLENNLLRMLKSVLPREDTFEGADYAKKLKSGDFEYEKISRDSMYTRGIFHELGYMVPSDYMYIVKTGPYLVLAIYEGDPERFLLDVQRTRVVKKGANGEEHPDTQE